MKIKTFLKKLFSKRVRLIGKKQLRQNKNCLVLKGYNGYDFISQKENWSAFYRLPYSSECKVEPKVVFEELLVSLKQLSENELEKLLSGQSSESINSFFITPREGILYEIVVYAGILKDEILAHKQFQSFPRLRINFKKDLFSIDELLYVVQQLHMLQAICSVYWKRNAAMEGAKTLFETMNEIFVDAKTFKEIRRLDNTLVSKVQYELRIDSGVSFEDLSWSHVNLNKLEEA